MLEAVTKDKLAGSSDVIIEPTKEAAQHIVRLMYEGCTIIKNAVPSSQTDLVIQAYLSWVKENQALANCFKKASGFNSRLLNFYTIFNTAFSLMPTSIFINHAEPV